MHISCSWPVATSEPEFAAAWVALCTEPAQIVCSHQDSSPAQCWPSMGDVVSHLSKSDDLLRPGSLRHPFIAWS